MRRLLKHPALLVSAYALVAALAVPGSILAQEEAAPAGTDTAPAEPPAPDPAPAELSPEPAELAAAPAEPAPAPVEPAPAPAKPAAAPAEPRPKALAAASGSVTIADFSFTPGTITVDQGDTVTWANSGPSRHSATSTSGAFDTGILDKGGSGSHTFDQAGTYSYICKPHPFMHGTVVVRAAQTGGDTSGSGGGETGGTGDTGGSGAAEAAGSGGGPALPNTGADSGALIVLGALMLLLGIGVHWVTSRAHEQEDPRSGGQARP